MKRKLKIKWINYPPQQTSPFCFLTTPVWTLKFQSVVKYIIYPQKISDILWSFWFPNKNGHWIARNMSHLKSWFAPSYWFPQNVPFDIMLNLELQLWWQKLMHLFLAILQYLQIKSSKQACVSSVLLHMTARAVVSNA